MYLCIVEMPRNSIRKENYSIEPIFRFADSRKNHKEFCNRFVKKKKKVTRSFHIFILSFPVTDQQWLRKYL